MDPIVQDYKGFESYMNADVGIWCGASQQFRLVLHSHRWIEFRWYLESVARDSGKKSPFVSSQIAFFIYFRLPQHPSRLGSRPNPLCSTLPFSHYLSSALQQLQLPSAYKALHAMTAIYLLVSPEEVTDAGNLLAEGWCVQPSLVVLPPPVLHHAMLSFKPLCAFYAIPLTQPRQVLGWFGSFALSKLFG